MTTLDHGLVARLDKAIRGRVVADEPLSRYSTFRIGGPATVAHPAAPEDVATLIQMCHQAGVPWLALGLGSNVLLPDAGLNALVIRLGKGLDAVNHQGDAWTFGAGLPAPRAARLTAAAGHAGLHQMVGVPGTVGGGVYMNAGCHGTDWAAVLTSATVATVEGADLVLQRGSIPFGYRSSGLGPVIVLEATVSLPPEDPAKLEEEVRRLFAWRESGTPFKQPCCGSTFTNPVLSEPHPTGLRSAGQFIDAAGLKGARIGGAEISTQHANYFINRDGASARDVLDLMLLARDEVKRLFGVGLTPEVRIIGTSGKVVDLQELEGQ